MERKNPNDYYMFDARCHIYGADDFGMELILHFFFSSLQLLTPMDKYYMS